MSGFLIDTNVLSEYNRPGGPDAGVKRWLETTNRQSRHVSVITLEEIQKGIELPAEGKPRLRLEQWLKQGLEAWFSLMAQRARVGRPLPTVDSLIAATALAHGLTIVTRNTRDFAGIGATINPWEAA